MFVRRDLINLRNISKFTSRDLLGMTAEWRLPTAWLFVFEVHKFCVLFLREPKDKGLAYTGYVMSKVATVRTMKAYRGSSCITPPNLNFCTRCIAQPKLNFGTRWRKVVNWMLRPLYPCWKTSVILSQDPSAGRGHLEKKKPGN